MWVQACPFRQVNTSCFGSADKLSLTCWTSLKKRQKRAELEARDGAGALLYVFTGRLELSPILHMGVHLVALVRSLGSDWLQGCSEHTGCLGGHDC